MQTKLSVNAGGNSAASAAFKNPLVREQDTCRNLPTGPSAPGQHPFYAAPCDWLPNFKHLLHLSLSLLLLHLKLHKVCVSTCKQTHDNTHMHSREGPGLHITMQFSNTCQDERLKVAEIVAPCMQ
jgi:hypothetical protein